jgi:hypothetical protein
MTLSKKTNWAPALRMSVRDRTVRTSARPVTQTRSLRIDHSHLAELRDWGILAGVSLAGWITAAIAFGIV